MVTKALKRTTPLVEKVVRELRGEIINQGFKVGDKLPPVTTWASKLSVSDKTIQQVLAQLRKEGVLTSHVGRGTFLDQIPGQTDAVAGKTNAGNGSFCNTIAILDGQSEVDLTCEHTESWTTRIVHGMRVEAAANSIDILLLNENLELSSLSSRVADLAGKVDGVITFPFTDNYTMFDLFDKYNIPIITINRPGTEARYNYVGADYFDGSKMVGALFAEIKCKKVWHLTTQMTGIFSKEQRYKGLIEGLMLSGNNCDVKVVIVDSATDREGCRAVKELLDTEGRPDGIYCSGDYLALGAINALKQASIPVGTEDGTSVVGSSGFELSSHIDPALTVVQIPMIEMGRRAVRRMLSLRQAIEHRVSGDIIPTKLILRDSTPSRLKEQKWLEKIEEAKNQMHV